MIFDVVPKRHRKISIPTVLIALASVLYNPVHTLASTVTTNVSLSAGLVTPSSATSARDFRTSSNAPVHAAASLFSAFTHVSPSDPTQTLLFSIVNSHAEARAGFGELGVFLDVGINAYPP